MELNNWEEKFEVCIYAEKLLGKITHLNDIVKTPPVDIKEVKKAIYYAKKYHDGQMRASGDAYYTHPLEVAIMAVDEFLRVIPDLFRTDIIVTAILHDTIEDTKLTKDMIKLVFGELVASQVEDLTRIKENRKISSAEMVENLYRENKKDILLVKLFDRLHNMQTIGAKSPEKIKKIVNETLEYFVILAIFFEHKIIEQELVSLSFKNKSICIEKFFSIYQIFSYDNFLLPLPNFQNDLIHKHKYLSIE